MKDKYGTYILKLMAVIMDTDQEKFIRQLSWDELGKIKDDLNSFLINKQKLLNDPELDKNPKQQLLFD